MAGAASKLSELKQLCAETAKEAEQAQCLRMIQALGLSRSSLKSYREAVRLQKVQFWHHHNF